MVIETVVIQRDGILLPCERAGAEQAMVILRREGSVSENALLTCLEIPKESTATLRLFEKEHMSHGNPHVYNPIVGTYYLADESNGDVCTTGWPFLRAGTAKPLYIRKLSGPLPLVDCLEDVFPSPLFLGRALRIALGIPSRSS